MIHSLTTAVGALTGGEVLHHLVMDFIVKGVIVAAAIAVVGTVMVVLWRTVGRRR